MSTPRYFINKPLNNTDEVPEGSVVNHSPGANIDYLSSTHEMSERCDCKSCVKHFAKG